MRIKLYKAMYPVIILMILTSFITGEESKNNFAQPYWQLIESPTKTKLNYINIFTDNYGLIIGYKILKFDGSK